KVRARLSKWKVKTLFVGGRLTLLKSVLGAVPIYNMSLFKTPKRVLHEMEMIRNRFFNGGDDKESRIMWVTWEKIRVGDGSNTRFWLDTWILDSPLYVRFPRLFALESVKDISVAVKWGAPSLNTSFRRRARDGVESNQWSEFCSMLDSVTLSSSP
nr:RNA-directed DNA polymerase, eukaryota, reverse transcriptase zinc-binding domain protein [Tanacetum cinerariifolium]